jgi:hypothetical protein
MKLDRSLWALLCLGLVARLLFAWLDLKTYAAFDLESYQIVQGIVRHGGNVYAETARYNYSPLWSWILGALDFVQRGLGLPAHLVVCSFLTGVDAVSCWLLARLATLHGLSARSAVLAFWLNPVSSLLTSLHGQFDSLAILFLLACLWVQASGRGRAWAWAAASAAIMVKQIVLFAPLYVLLRAFPNRFWRLVAWGTCALPFFLSLAPYWAGAAKGITYHVLLYSSQPELYGLTTFFPISRSRDPMALLHVLRGVLFLALVGGAMLLPRRADALRAALLAPLVFLAFTPGFAMQYLILPVALGALRADKFFGAYTAIASFTLLGAYQLIPGVWGVMPLVLVLVWTSVLAWLACQVRAIWRERVV